MGRPSTRTKWLVTLGSPLAALVLLELGLRAAGFQQTVFEVPVVVWTPEQDGVLDASTALHQKDPWSLWAPRPGARTRLGPHERINALGFRGPELRAERTPGVLRVVLLGESSTYGLGVTWAETCAPRLEAALAERGRPAQVVNAGVIGHTAPQGLQRYRAAVRPLRPDVVLIAFGTHNEPAPCQGFPDTEKLELAARQREGEGDRWVALSRHVRVFQLVNQLMLGRYASELQQRRDEELRLNSLDPDLIGQIGWPGCRRVPPADFESALASLCAEVRADGAQPVLCSLPRLPETEARRPILPCYTRALERVADALQVPIVDAHGTVAAAIAAGADPQSFFIATDTWHLGGKGQAVLAALAVEAIVELPDR